MKILFVSIPNHHFFQWANQLKDAGHEVHWFDITDGAGFSSKINWIQQHNGWKLRWNFPGRYFIKRKFPSIYQFINRFNTHKTATVFDNLLATIQPDVIHCFEMNLSGIPILPVLEKYPNIPLIYSSWGSDLYDFKSFGLSEAIVKQFLQRVDYLITDCKRDYQLALSYGFSNAFLGVFPGNGGILFQSTYILPTEERDIILVKGYEDGVGKALNVLEAIQELGLFVIQNYKIVVYSADKKVVDFIATSRFYESAEVFERNHYIPNEAILEFMGKSVIHIGNSVSDGMPNSLLEAMGMGAFPIQTNPGGATEEVVEHGVNGYLITFPESKSEIAHLIKSALTNLTLRKKAQEYNVSFMNAHYNRAILQSKIVALYQNLLP
ncbi:glycosyltransferase family 4 protein [Flavobacterium celericrescens]|uniref:Glycosyltransferase family 4 protein n=1 Tax=Flavobacterium celericrescens TaxID=2709780 RepID=A0ABX0IEV9_9FLAO|nr:glycosyltransferase family 4 protein [Flavobacterium celericrescens]NHM05051.1 glycosyltransferase family 4 protein [Flavobacterium celericrescens]